MSRVIPQSLRDHERALDELRHQCDTRPSGKWVKGELVFDKVQPTHCTHCQKPYNTELEPVDFY